MNVQALTLPAWLAHQAGARAHAIALRHKTLGIWQAFSWTQLQQQVLRVAASLQASGFRPGQQLVILSRPRPEALIGALAAQWLGGVAALFDPLQETGAQGEVLRQLSVDFVLAEGLEEITRLRDWRLEPHWLVYADARGLVDELSRGGAVEYARLPAIGDMPVPMQAQAVDMAFVFYQLGAAGLERQFFSHAQLLKEARPLVEQQGLSDQEQALAARAFAASGQARYLLAPWLLAGFVLNFPERLETRDQDRRELGPTLVLGTRETYGRLYARVLQRLPLPGTLHRRLLDWALQEGSGRLATGIGEVLIRRPLRDVLGVGRVRVALLAGPPLDERTQRFFAVLGVQVLGWPGREVLDESGRYSTERALGLSVAV
ncbi:AMP-binding protein [Pseudomonas ovata]|uniref:AMP-binding protein n=1 Tax=Pseudomonas ovata TaxID=1839709 RepID=UPI000D68DDFC|nr:AMP-binding protein [Pseudomonas ovata]